VKATYPLPHKNENMFQELLECIAVSQKVLAWSRPFLVLRCNIHLTHEWCSKPWIMLVSMTTVKQNYLAHQLGRQWRRFPINILLARSIAFRISTFFFQYWLTPTFREEAIIKNNLLWARIKIFKGPGNHTLLFEFKVPPIYKKELRIYVEHSNNKLWTDPVFLETCAYVFYCLAKNVALFTVHTCFY
jgi:hypothetical protein